MKISSRPPTSFTLDQHLQIFQQKIDYQFQQLDLLERALTHRSAGTNHNERLEFLGDSIVNSLVAELLYHEYPTASEGELSAMRAKLVCKESLASIARSLNLGEYLLLGGGTLKTGGRQLDSILADGYEALLGAIYLDGDWLAVKRLVSVHFAGRTSDLGDMKKVRDAKSRLQEWLQAKKLPLPEYQLMEIDGPGHSQRFRVRCHVPEIPGDHLGVDSNMRKAEQQAAKQVLDVIENSYEQ